MPIKKSYYVLGGELVTGHRSRDDEIVDIRPVQYAFGRARDGRLTVKVKPPKGQELLLESFTTEAKIEQTRTKVQRSGIPVRPHEFISVTMISFKFEDQTVWVSTDHVIEVRELNTQSG